MQIGCHQGRSPQSLLLCLLLTRTGYTLMDLQTDYCEPAGASALAPSSLLQISAHGDGQMDRFGPGLCVGVKRNSAGSCEIQTRCAGKNISQTDFSFVCVSPSATVPHTLHNYGRGGFASEESFDTNIHCDFCMSTDTAYRTGDEVVKSALSALSLNKLSSLNGALRSGPAYSAAELKQFVPKEEEVYGPSSCISTFKAPSGTCLIRMRCANIDLSKFNVGITCDDGTAGPPTRYLFAKDTFKEEETFDTLIACKHCLGVGQGSSKFSMDGLLPRRLVDDVTTMKVDVQTMTEKVRVLQQFLEAQQDSSNPVHEHNEDMRASHGHREEGHHDHHFATQQGSASVPTVMMTRRESLDIPEAAGAGDGIQAGAETASVDAGSVHMISHRRGSAIAELFKLAASK